MSDMIPRSRSWRTRETWILEEKVSHPILFLDVDGVLNNGVCMSRGVMIDPLCVLELNRIMEEVEDLDIVISSVWRSNGLDPMRFLLGNTGLRAQIRSHPTERYVFGERIISVTPHLDIGSRGSEIEAWLERNHVDGKDANFVIVDDDTDMLDEQMPRFVRTDTMVGMTPNCADRCIKILKGEK